MHLRHLQLDPGLTGRRRNFNGGCRDTAQPAEVNVPGTVLDLELHVHATRLLREEQDATFPEELHAMQQGLHATQEQRRTPLPPSWRPIPAGLHGSKRAYLCILPSFDNWRLCIVESTPQNY